MYKVYIEGYIFYTHLKTIIEEKYEKNTIYINYIKNVIL